MASQTRSVSGINASANGLPFDPTIRIPPIQDPSPLQVISSHRPSPLEPSAAESNRPSAVRLNSRSKALANAQPLAGDASLRPLDTSRLSNSQRSTQEESDEAGPRKRQRTSYVQLPQPQKPSELGRNTSLDAIPRVNQLNEPPPSAARFPPITTTNGSPHIIKPRPRSTTNRDSATTGRRAQRSQIANEQNRQESAESPASTDEPKKPKRNYTRGRRMWSEEETDHLLKGVARYGVGKWKRILNDPEYTFPSDRTAVDLKDRYRTCRMHEERKIERDAHGEHLQEESTSLDSSKTARKSQNTPPVDAKDGTSPPTATSDAGVKSKKNQEKKPKADEQQEKPGMVFASVNTVQAMAEELAKKAEPTPPKWSAEDDSNLSRGFQKHGFHWTAISKDPELNLHDRTGPQLRDRFRVKFPIHYQSSVPIELPEPAQGYDRDQRPRRRIAPKGGIKVSLKKAASSESVAQTNQEPFQEKRAKNMSIADIIKPADAAQTPRISKPSLPSMQSLCARVDAQPLPEPTLGNSTFIDAQPLPEEGEDFDESDFEENGMSQDDYEEDRSPDDEDSGEDTDERARARDDARHLGILGLLNETEAETTIGHRLPPFKSTYDVADEEWQQNSVTLPPLLLEAQRPMFELD